MMARKHNCFLRLSKTGSLTTAIFLIQVGPAMKYSRNSFLVYRHFFLYHLLHCLLLFLLLPHPCLLCCVEVRELRLALSHDLLVDFCPTTKEYVRRYKQRRMVAKNKREQIRSGGKQLKMRETALNGQLQQMVLHGSVVVMVVVNCNYSVMDYLL